MTDIISTFLQFSSQIKLYHWQTTNYARHIASDKLYKNINSLIDQFIEVYQGKHKLRLQIENNIKINNLDDEDIITYLFSFKGFLMDDLEDFLDDGMRNTDLINIRDEMLSTINQTLYLFTLN
jgi:hypothetical protein